jgi:cell division protein FtsI (penicillin-binding protein 3)
VIQKSSNVGTVKIAMQMQPARDVGHLHGQPALGRSPSSVSRRGEWPFAPYKTWRPIEQATMSYGYGLSASLFQMARRTPCLPRRAIIPATMLKSDEPPPACPCSRAQPPLAVRKMLQMAAGPGGTGQRRKPWATRWAASPAPPTSRWARATPTNKYRGWFTGMAPIDKPRIVVAVMIDEPSNGKYYGGDVAAPVFSETVQQTLRMMGVQPDMAVKPQIVAQAVEESCDAPFHTP